MMSYKKETLFHKTPSKQLSIEVFLKTIPIETIYIRKKHFLSLCQSGCPNYGYKYSCPPYSPHFSKFFKNCGKATIVCYRLELNQYSNLRVYSGIRAGNSVLKSLIDKRLYEYKERGVKVAGSGSCRACKPCGAKTNQKCKKPDKLIFSLESLGVDVNNLVETCFDFSLQWYSKENKNPAYTCTVGGIFE